MPYQIVFFSKYVKSTFRKVPTVNGALSLALPRAVSSFTHLVLQQLYSRHSRFADIVVIRKVEMLGNGEPVFDSNLLLIEVK